MHRDQSQSSGVVAQRNAVPKAEAVTHPKRTVFSIKSIMVITTVFAASAVSGGYLWRAVRFANKQAGQLNESENLSALNDLPPIGYFVVINAMLPMVVLPNYKFGAPASETRCPLSRRRFASFEIKVLETFALN